MMGRSYKHVSLAWLICVALGVLALITPGRGDRMAAAGNDLPPEVKPYISGNHMVWVQTDAEGDPQIMYRSLSGGDTLQITNAKSVKDVPKVSEGKDGHIYIVWSDKRRYHPDAAAWDLYGYNMETGEELKLNPSVGFYVTFSIGGSDVVWYDNFSQELIHYDFKTREAKSIGQGREPVVADGKVLYINVWDGGLSLYTFATVEKRSVLKLPNHLNVINFTFNGKYVLYKQADLDWNTKYVMLDVADPAAKPVDLTPATKKENEYYQLFIGDSKGAWIQETGGTPQLMGVSLGGRNAVVVASGAEVMQALAVRSDQVLLRSPEGNIAYKEIPSQGDAGSNPAAIPPDLNPSNKKIMGIDGGQLTADGGKIKLTVPKGALRKEQMMELKENVDKTQRMGAEVLLASMRSASTAWDLIAGEDKLGTVMLSYTYDPLKWTGIQAKKLAVYRWDGEGESWALVGGRVNTGTQEVAVELSGQVTGTYALMLKDVSFGDVRDHWSRESVEILASRGIVGGVEDGRFAPEQQLTRAEFTKMLLGAMGIQPAAGDSPFIDVPVGHWSASWVKAAVERGLVQGDGAYFYPDQALTREEMMVMLVRAMNEGATAAAMSLEDADRKIRFKDKSEISDWAKGYVALAADYRLIEGDEDGLHPGKTSIRAEAAAVIHRLLMEWKAL